jgi:hypothetical protein
MTKKRLGVAESVCVARLRRPQRHSPAIRCGEDRLAARGHDTAGAAPRFAAHRELRHRLSLRRVVGRQQKPVIGGRWSIGERTARPAF